MNIIFTGTPEFAVPSLKTLLKHHHVLAVVTQPDRPFGRGQTKKASPVKEYALKYQIPIFTKPINQLASQIQNLKPDLIVVVAYGKILSQKILDTPRFGAINLHASLLPKYRGASPIQAAILNGDRETGVSIIQMTPKLDAGPIIAQAKIKITPNETAGSLHDKLANLGAELLKKVLGIYPLGVNKRLKPKLQDETFATYTQKITSSDAKLDLSKPAKILERQIRAYNPWPGAFITIKNSKLKIKNYRLKIFKAEIKKKSNHPLALKCGDSNLLIPLELQPEGRQKMSAEEFVRGYLSNQQKSQLNRDNQKIFIDQG